MVVALGACTARRAAGPGAESAAVITDRGRAALDEGAYRYEADEWEARTRLLLSLASMRAGRYRDSLVYLDEAEQAGGLAAIGDYLHLFRARAYTALGRHMRTVRSYEKILALYPDSVLSADARWSLARALVAAGRTAGARDAFRAFTAAHPRDPRAAGAMLEVVRLSLSAELDDVAGARRAARRIIVEHPAEEAGEDALVILSSLEAPWPWPQALTPGVFAPLPLGPGELIAKKLDTEQRLSRAERLYKAARYDAAAAELRELREGGDKDLRARTAVRYAASLVRLGRHRDAEKVIFEYLQSSPNPASEGRALYWLMESVRRRGELGKLEDIERGLASSAPSSAQRVQALFSIGRLLEARGETRRAVVAYQRALDAGRAGTDGDRAGQRFYVDEAAWRAGWLNYRSGRFVEALDIFSSHDEPRPRRAEGGRFLYWSARSAEKLGRHAEASGFYERVCSEFEDGYYCALARGRGARTGDARRREAAVEEVEDRTTAFEGDRHYRAARELMAMGLGSLASREIEALSKRYPDSDPGMKEIALLFYDSGDYYRAFVHCASYLSGHGSMQGAWSRGLMYPMGVVDLVRLNAHGAGVDAYLVAAIIREESSFNPKVVSRAGAVGIMQIMPDTADYITHKLGEELVDTKGLMDVRTSIRLGSWYLGRIGARFGNDTIRTVAAYNAGPTAVAKWVRSLPAEPDEFVESIPYDETRTYTKRVIASYSAYLRLAERDRTALERAADRDAGQEKG